jgi:transcriptional regulator with XRE-family HTH domain
VNNSYLPVIVAMVDLVESLKNAMPDIDFVKRRNLAKILTEQAIPCGSQSNLARSIGLKTGTLSTYMRGESYPNPINLQKIAEYLGRSLEEFESSLESAAPLEDSCYRLRGESAEEFFPVVLQLPKEEKLRLAKHLINSVV